jgi:hypothetical protein
VRYACSYSAQSVMGRATDDGVRYGGPSWDPNALPGPVYRDLAVTFPGQALLLSEGYLVVNDVPSRRVTVTIYTPTHLATPTVLAAGQTVMSDACGTPASVISGS